MACPWERTQGQPLEVEKGQEKGSPQGLQKECSSAHPLDFILCDSHRTSDLQHWEVIHLRYFKPLILWL